MKPKKSIAGILILILCVAVFFGFQRRKANHDDRSNKNQSKQSINESFPGVMRAKDPRIDDYWRAGEADPAILRNYVEESGNSAEAITWAYLLTIDSSYLEKLKNHPDSELALQMLARFDVGTESRLYWAEQLDRKDPTNGLGKLLMARAFLEGNDPDAAIKAYAKAVKAERFSSPLHSRQQPLVELLKRLSPTKTTDYAIHGIIPAESHFASTMFPDRFDGLFANKSKDEAAELAINIQRVSDRMYENNFSDLLNIQGFSDLGNPKEELRTNLFMAFESKYGKGSAKTVYPLSLDEMCDQSSERVNRIRSENARLTPAQVDARVRTGIEDLAKKSKKE